MGMLATPNRSQTAVRRREAGQALVFTALAIVVLMGFAGLGIDMGILRYEKRLQQNAADAAAIAGASNLCLVSPSTCNSGYGGVQSGGQSAAAANGFADNGGGALASCTNSGAAVGTICVQVQPGPTRGPHAGQLNYVEAFVSVVQPTYFMRILNISKQVITARAVAGDIGGQTCLLTLGDINVAGQINFPTAGPSCGLTDDGNLNLLGGAVNNALFTSVVLPNQSIPVAGDPLAYLPSPVPAGGLGACLAETANSGNIALNPNQNYCLNLTGTANLTFNQPGVYYFSGFNDTSSGTVTGTGVSIYVDSGAFSLVGPTIQLSAPTTSPLAGVPSGILIWQNSTDIIPATLDFSVPAGSSNLEGLLYYPSASLTIRGSNAPPTYLNVIANSLSVQVAGGDGTLSLGDDPGALGIGAAPMSGPTLVE